MPVSKVFGAFVVNGERHEVAYPPHHTLLEVLREECGLTGTKHGCELGECGACTVRVDGKPVLSCLVLAQEAVSTEGEEHQVDTIEGLQNGPDLHPLQDFFAELGASQCGYCSAGFLMSASELLEKTLTPTRDEIRGALAGNICRCTGYIKIFEAVELAAAKLRGEDATPTKEMLHGRD